MIKFYNKYRVLGNWANIFLLLCTLSPLLALSYYNHPSPADDYCYIDTVFKYGWLEAMNFYYTGWTGRYFGILLNHSNPLVFHSFTGFKVLPAILLVAFVYSLYTFFRHVTPTLSRLAHLGFAGVVFFLFVLQMASMAEAFYWMAAFVGYTLANSLTLLWIVLILRWYRMDTHGAKVLTAALSAVLAACIIGSTETSMLALVLLLAGWWGYRIIFHRKVDSLMLISLFVSAVSCYFLFTAPGNAARLGGNSISGDLILSVVFTFKKLVQLSFKWLIGGGVAVFSLAWLVVLTRMSDGARNYFSLPVWYVFLLYVGIMCSQLFPSYYAVGVGVDPTPRVINCVYFFFLIGWFYMIGVVFHAIKRRSQENLNVRPSAYAMLFVVLPVFIAFSVYRSTNVKIIYRDLLRGGASAYDKEMKHRYALLTSTKDRVVYLPAIKSRPQSLFVDEIQSNPKFLWNRCMAGYFGKDTIYLKPE